jgi:signal transduction histidine kinase
LERIVADLTENRDLTTAVHFVGPLGVVGDTVAENAEAVVAEAVSNAVRHAKASRLDVRVIVAEAFRLEITDDGDGIPLHNERASGLANMHRRAEVLGGACKIDSAPGGGTRVHWTVPLLAE